MFSFVLFFQGNQSNLFDLEKCSFIHWLVIRWLIKVLPLIG